MNVRDFGAQGDARTNDTLAVERAIDAAPDGATIYFPEGRYLLCLPFPEIRPVTVRGRRCLRFVGEGPYSELRRQRGTDFEAVRATSNTPLDWDLLKDEVPGILLFEDCEDICLEHLGFDGNNFAGVFARSRALVDFVKCRRVRVTHNYATDRDPRDLYMGNYSLYPFFPILRAAFGVRYDPPREARGPLGETSWDVRIEDNTLDGLGIFARHVRRLWIAHNAIANAVPHGIVVGGRDHYCIHEDVMIVGNTINEPRQSGVQVLNVITPFLDRDDGSVRHASEDGQVAEDPNVPIIGLRMARVSVADNVITRGDGGSLHRTVGGGIIVGSFGGSAAAGEGSGSADASVYRDIRIERNLIHDTLPNVDAGDPWMPFRWGISLLLRPFEGSGTGIPHHFSRAVISDNVIRGLAGSPALRLTALRQGLVSGNGVYGGGLRLEAGISSTHVQGNRVSGYIRQHRAFELAGSLGGNFFVGNVDLASPMRTTRWAGDDPMVTDHFGVVDEVGPP